MASKYAIAGMRYGRLWARGRESFGPSQRSILSVKGKGATTYLQGLVTCDLLSVPPPARSETLSDAKLEDIRKGEKELSEDYMNVEEDVLDPESMATKTLRSACFLDQKGRNLTDALLWKVPKEEDDGAEEYLIDIPTDSQVELLEHLKRFKLRRSKVDIQDKTSDFSSHTIYGTLNHSGSPPGFISVEYFIALF